MPTPLSPQAKRDLAKAYAAFLKQVKTIAKNYKTTVKDVVGKIDQKHVEQIQEMLKGIRT